MTPTMVESNLGDQDDAQILQQACIFYSSRSDRLQAQQLIDLSHPWLKKAACSILDRLEHLPVLYDDMLRVFWHADMVATYLEWVSRRSWLPQAEKEELRELAESVCIKALGRIDGISAPTLDHTVCLIKLTLVQIYVAERQILKADGELSAVKSLASEVKDPKQKARVYRKIGVLLPKVWITFRGYGWILKALFVRGAEGTRLKSLAALCGIER